MMNDIIDKLNFDLLDQYAEKTLMDGSSGKYFNYYWSFTENDIKTTLFGNKRNRFVMWQIPPPPVFFKIYKEYHPNGYLKVKGKRMGGGATMIGEWEYYDELGQLISKKDEDKKFSKFGYNELLLFLHQQGHINLETGENREDVDFGYDVEKKEWGVYAVSKSYWTTEMVIDGETGAIKSQKEYQGGII